MRQLDLIETPDTTPTYDDRPIQNPDRLKSLEAKMKRSFVEIGLALKEIRDSGLYRLTHESFESYCQERWNMASRQYALKLISAAELCEDFRHNDIKDLPQNEFQCRPLVESSLTPQEKRAAWVEAVEQSESRLPSAKHVRHVVDFITQSKDTLAPGSKCEILSGNYEGKLGTVVRIEGGAVVWIRLDGRQQEYPYFLSELRPCGPVTPVPPPPPPKPTPSQRLKTVIDALTEIVQDEGLPPELKSRLESLIR